MSHYHRPMTNRIGAVHFLFCLAFLDIDLGLPTYGLYLAIVDTLKQKKRTTSTPMTMRMTLCSP